MYQVIRTWCVFYTRRLSVWAGHTSSAHQPHGGQGFPSRQRRAGPLQREAWDEYLHGSQAGCARHQSETQGTRGQRHQVSLHSTATRALITPHKIRRDLRWSPRTNLPPTPCSGHTGLLAALQMPQGCSCHRAFAFVPRVPWNTVLSDLLVSDQMSP